MCVSAVLLTHNDGASFLQQLAANRIGNTSDALFKKRSYILSPPCRDARTKLDRAGIAPRLNTRPPCRLADRDRPYGCENGLQTHKTSFWKNISLRQVRLLHDDHEDKQT